MNGAELQHISAMSLFVEDLRAAKAFYIEVFGVPVIYEDANSVAVRGSQLGGGNRISA
jgi:predicted enzyme related to lactoylglutathione lyase